MHREVLDVCDTGIKVAVPSDLRAGTSAHWAPRSASWPPPGDACRSGSSTSSPFTDGRISSITMVADELGALAPINAAALVS